VPGVRKQGERVSHHSRDDLPHHHAEDEDERDGQRFAVSLEPMIVVVVRTERLVGDLLMMRQRKSAPLLTS
jgi:hypothetical protein